MIGRQVARYETNKPVVLPEIICSQNYRVRLEEFSCWNNSRRGFRLANLHHRKCKEKG